MGEVIDPLFLGELVDLCHDAFTRVAGGLPRGVGIGTGHEEPDVLAQYVLPRDPHAYVIPIAHVFLVQLVDHLVESVAQRIHICGVRQFDLDDAQHFRLLHGPVLERGRDEFGHRHDQPRAIPIAQLHIGEMDPLHVA